MDQNWLSVAGIGIDLVGFVLLLREWWLAFFHESSVIESERQLAWQRSLRRHQQTHASDALKSHLDTSARLQDEMRERAAYDRHIATLKSRKGAFVTATVLIVLGGVLQLVGALPPDVYRAVTFG